MKRTILLAITAAAFASMPVFGDNSTLGVTVGPEATFTALSASTSLTKGDSTFGNYGGTTSFTYKIRTTEGGGSGSITVQVTTFSAGGPAVADLAYTCTAPSSGTPCASTPASTSSGTSVVGFGADAHSADVGDSGTAIWSLVDRPQIKTGSYSSTATFTISAL
jgi:hypothetical protein